jgi:hypothetical protein
MLVHVWYEHYIVKSYKWNWMWESYVNIGVFSVIKLTVQYRKLLKIWFTKECYFCSWLEFCMDHWYMCLCYLYIFTYTQCVVLNDETWSFMATKSFIILGKRYQSDFSHTDPACQLQQQWTKWWLDRFTLDFSDVHEHEAWMIYEQ